ncbi:MAG: hypothetical protein IT435_17780 [Phycisphaerales bacterium]|nr:hypothetical protein [Phycisphaerales bacterium]
MTTAAGIIRKNIAVCSRRFREVASGIIASATGSNPTAIATSHPGCPFNLG